MPVSVFWNSKTIFDVVTHSSVTCVESPGVARRVSLRLLSDNDVALMMMAVLLYMNMKAMPYHQ